MTTRNSDLVYGAHAVLEALQGGRELDKILWKKGASADTIDEILKLARAADVPVQRVPVETLDRLAHKGNHQGILAFAAVIAYAPMEEVLMSAFDRGESPIMLVLDGVTDVRNFGAIARTAECFGVNGVIIPVQGAAKINADAMKISSGALNYLPVSRFLNLEDSVLIAKSYGLKVYACTEKAGQSLYQTKFDSPAMFIFGAEDMGISRKIAKMADEEIKIPLTGKIESLNVGVSVGVVLSEITRQRSLV